MPLPPAWNKVGHMALHMWVGILQNCETYNLRMLNPNDFKLDALINIIT